MAETIGQAVYELDLDAGKFTVKQGQVEAQFKASQGRIDAAAQRSAILRNKVGIDAVDHANFETKVAAALASQWGVTGQATTVAATKSANATGVAAAASSKLSNEQKILNGALRTSSSQLAQQIPFMRGFSSAMGAASVAAPALGGALIGGALAYTVLDSAVKHFTGNGLIDYLTGAARSHELAAAAALDQGIAENKLAVLSQIGVTGNVAGTIELNREMRKLTDAQTENANSLAEIAKERLALASVPITQAGARAGDLNLQENAANDALAAKVKVSEDNLKDMLDKGKISLDQFRIAAQNPLFGDHFKKDLDEIDAALGIVRGSIEATAQVLRTAREEFDKGLKIAVGELDRADPISEALKLQLLLLEEEKRRLEDIGDTKGVDQVKTQIDALNNAIAETEAPAKIAQQAVLAWGAATIEAAGNNEQAVKDATAAVKLLGAEITELPREAQLKLTLLDPEHIRDLLTAMAAGLSFDVAIRLVTGTAAQVDQNLAGAWAGSTPGSPQSTAVQKIVASDNTAFDEFTRRIDATSKAAGDASGNFAKLEKATKHILTLDEALADMIITADEMRTLNENGADLDVAKVAALELVAEGEGRVTDARFRELVELSKLAQLFPGLTGAEVEFRLGLAAIAKNLEETHRTAEQFQLDEWLKPKFDAVKSMIDEIFSKPTRESLTLELKKKKLEQQKLLLERGGADASNVGKKGTKGHPAPEASRADKQLASIDKQIEAVQREIDLRQTDMDILKIETELKDKTLQTDQDLLNANQFLGTALDSLSGSVKSVEDALGIRLFDAALKAASGLQAAGAAGGTGFTAAEKHWINGVAIANGEAPPFPGFALGTLGAPQTSLALIHKGEPVLPPDVGDMFRDVYKLWSTPQLREVTPRSLTDGSSGGHSGPISISVWANDDAEIMRKVNRALSDTLRVKKYGGSTPSNSASR